MWFNDLRSVNIWFVHLKQSTCLHIKPEVVASKQADVSSCSWPFGVSALPPRFELLDASPAKHYDSFHCVLQCCVSPPGRFSVILAKPELQRGVIACVCAYIPMLTLLAWIKHHAAVRWMHWECSKGRMPACWCEWSFSLLTKRVLKDAKLICKTDNSYEHRERVV